MSTFEKLIDQRKRLKIKQKHMAKQLGVTTSTMSRYESGERLISADMQDTYAEVLGINLYLIINNDE